MLLSIARVIFLLAMIVGGVSLGRVNEAFADLGRVGEVRFVGLFAASLLAVIAALVTGRVALLGSSTRRWIAAVLVLHVLVALSWLWSDRTAVSEQQLYEIALLAASIALGTWLFRSDPGAALRLLLLMFYGMALVFIVAAMALAGGLQGEIAALGAGGIGAGRVLGMGFVAATYLALHTGRGLWFLPAPLMAGGMLLSGSRASVLALLVGLGVVWWRRASIRAPQRKRTSPAVRTLRSIVALVLLAGFFALPYGRSLIVDFAQSLIVGAGAGSAEEGEPQVYLADRDVIFADAWSQTAANAVGGMGVGTYVGPFGENYPHNLLLGFGVDAGVLPMLLCAILLGLALLRLWRSRDGTAQAALAAAAFFGVGSMFAGTYYDARFVWLCLALGMMLLDGERLRTSARSRGGIAGILLLRPYT